MPLIPTPTTPGHNKTQPTRPQITPDGPRLLHEEAHTGCLSLRVETNRPDIQTSEVTHTNPRQ